MSKKSSNNLIVRLKVSVGLTVVLGLLHLGAGVLLLVVPLPTLLRTALLVAALLSLIHVLTQHAFRRRSGSIVALRLNNDGDLTVKASGEKKWRAATINGRFVHRWMVLLSMRVTGQRLSTRLVLAPDAVEPDVFRRLRAALLAPPRNRVE